MSTFYAYKFPPPQEGDSTPEFLTGYFLISDTEMLDPNFYRTVVYILSHNAQGALGLVINRPSAATIADISTEDMADSPFSEHTVYVGGPVDQNYLFALHTGLQGNLKSENSIEAVDGIVFEPDFALLQQHFAHRSTIESTPLETDIRFFAGYAGWSAGQLEQELLRRDWVTLKAHPELVFRTDTEKIWNAALFRKGGIYSITAETGSKPSVN
ncbi:MAG: YqgE/AlgH family protein [Spirochaetaceae bacterium]